MFVLGYIDESWKDNCEKILWQFYDFKYSNSIVNLLEKNNIHCKNVSPTIRVFHESHILNQKLITLAIFFWNVNLNKIENPTKAIEKTHLINEIINSIFDEEIV